MTGEYLNNMQITVWAVYIALFQAHIALNPRGNVETQ